MLKFRRINKKADSEVAVCSCSNPAVVIFLWERIKGSPLFVCRTICMYCGKFAQSNTGLVTEDEVIKSAKEKWLVKVSGDLKDKAAVLRKESDVLLDRAKKIDNILKEVNYE